MKKKLVALLLVVLAALATIVGLILRNDDSSANEPRTLSTPVVTLTGDVASWNADPNADKFEISLDGNLSYVENSITEKTLTDGQTLKVRAVGDGVDYATSDWSNSVTFLENSSPNAPTPAKLSTPTVTISDSGLASWTAVENASGYVYKINGGEETPAVNDFVQLSDGQSFSVKAVGDGTNYLDGEYSSVVTYTANSSTQTDAPAYLGIFASNDEPSQANGLPDAFAARITAARRAARAGSYRDFGTALGEYFTNADNYLGANLPVAANYPIFSKAGETVYVQIWLNNPSQYTILSLKLNGTKYQVGGGLSSFFIEESGQRYNCVYVTVTLPSDAYAEKTYTVSDIEYIADVFINADGTDEFMNKNDTVSVGLPFNAQNPTVSDFNSTAITVNSCSATFSLADPDGLANSSGGWLGAAIYDGYDVVANQSAVIGSNTLDATGLVENSTYWAVVYLYGDLRDGNGASAHVLLQRTIRTLEAISIDEASGTLLYNSVKDGYYGAIKVKTTLKSDSAEYVKLEILDGEQEVVYTDTSYDGTATVSEGVLCGSSYFVRVYYKDTEYPEGKYVEQSAWINSLGTPWYREAGSYAFVNDAVYYFELNNNDGNYPSIEGFTLNVYDEESARWFAEDVLYILDNPTAIDDLQTQINALYDEFNAAYGNSELMNSIYARISELDQRKSKLESAKLYLENQADNNTDKAYWQAEAAKGKYYYTFEYNGTDTEKLFKVGKRYYATLDDALNLGANGLRVLVEFKYDKQDGAGLTEGTTNQYLRLDNLFYYNGTEPKNVELNGNELTFSLVNVDDYMLDDGGESTYEKGYVYKIFALNDDWQWSEVYAIDSVPALNVDEEAWFAEYIRRVKTGESIDELYELFIPEYQTSYSITLDLSDVSAGLKDFKICTRMRIEAYEDGEYDRDFTTQLGVYKQIEKPTITVAEEYGEYFGLVTPDGLAYYNGSYEYEGTDANGSPVEIAYYNEDGGAKFRLPAAGTKIRVKLTASEYWLESEWSEWYVFEGVKLAAPTLGEYSTADCTISWSLDDTTNISRYVYTINGGKEITVTLEGALSVFLKGGDVFRVKCVASEKARANGYVDSDWVEYTCTDNRTALATPSNVRVENGELTWDAVDGASYYILEWTYGDYTEIITWRKTSLSIKSGSTYRVKAATEDTENYRPSDWSESVTYTVE